MLALPSQEKQQSIFEAVLRWWYDRVGAILSPRERKRFAPGDATRVPQDPKASGVEFTDLPSCCYDASLLFRRMAKLQIDRVELATDDPLLFRELQGRCTLCRSKGQCVWDLAHEFDDVGWEKWHEYCPNAGTLSALATLQNCSLAARS